MSGMPPPGTMLRLLLLLALVALALALRLNGLWGEAAWHDEVVTLRHLDAPSYAAFMQGVARDDPYGYITPLYQSLQYAWVQVFGASTLAVRVLSVALGMITLPVLGLTAALLFGRAAGCWAAVFGAVHLLLIHYAQEVRFYPLVLLLAAGALCGLAAGQTRGARWGWALNFAANALLLWSHAFAGLVLIPQGLALLAAGILQRRRPWRAAWFYWGVAHAALAGAFFTYVALADYAVTRKVDYFTDSAGTPRDLANLFFIFTGARFQNRDISPALGGLPLDEWAALGVVLLSILGAWGVWRRAGAHAFGYVLLGLWLVVPPVLLYLLSQTWRPFFTYRYVAYSALAWPLLASAGAAGLGAWPRAQRAIAIGLVLLLCGMALALPRPWRPDFRAVGATIDATATPRTFVYTLKHHVYEPMRFHTQLPDAHVLHYGGYRELLRDATEATRAGFEVWAVFQLYVRTEDFERDLAARGIAVARTGFDGYPGPVLFRLRAVQSP